MTAGNIAFENVSVGNTVPGATSAAVDLSAKQYYIVKMTSSGVNLCGAGEKAIGILQNKTPSGGAAGYALSVAGVGSTSKVVIGEAITKGMALASDGNGKAVEADDGDAVVGIAMSSAGADGDLVACYQNPDRLPDGT